MIENEITVVIPAHKCATTIARTISSIRQQRDCYTRIIVVIDGEDAQIERVLLSLDGIKTISLEKNLGPQYCRNVGLQQASTEYITFLDADDVVCGELHGGMVAALKKAQGDIVFAAWQAVNEQLNPLAKRNSVDGYVSMPPSRDALITQWSNGEVSKTGAMSWKTSFLRGIGGWDETMQRYQDVDVGLRSLLAGGIPCFSAVGTLLYVSHNSNARVSSAAVGSRVRSMEAYFNLLERYAEESPSRDSIRRGIGLGYYKLAAKCFYEGSLSTGRECLKRSRAFGYLHHHGGKVRRIFSSLTGLENAVRLSSIVRRSRVIQWVRRGH